MSSPSIATRVLIEGMVTRDGTLDGQLLYDVAESCGLSAEQVRLGLRRLTADGTLQQHGRGRAAVYRSSGISATLRSARDDFLPLAFRQDEGESGWDGYWRLLSFGISEQNRAARDAIRYQLRYLGWAPLDRGTYVSVHANESMVEDVAAQHGVLDALSFARCDHLKVRGIHRPKDVAAALWPLDDIADGYAWFLDLVRTRSSAVEPTEAIAATFRVVTAFSGAVEFDPLLPPELLPAKWPGVKARRELRAWVGTAAERHPELGELTVLRLWAGASD